MRTRFSRHDRLWIGGTAYLPVDHDGTMLQLMRLDGSGAVERFTHEQLDEQRTSGDWRYERGYFALGEAKPLAKPDGTRLAALPPGRRNRVLFLHNACVVIHEMNLADELVLTEASLDKHRDLIVQRVAEREIGRNLAGQTPRGGDPLPMRQLPCPKTLLKHLRRFRLAGHNPDALVPRYDAACRPAVVSDLEAETLLRECIWAYATPEKPSKAQVARQTEDRFRKENSRREDAGLRPLHTVSRRTIERRIDRLDPFTVACHRDGPDRARRAFASYGAGLPRLFPMQRVEIDEWQVDVISLFSSLGITERVPPEVRDRIPKSRRWICVAIDCATRCIVGLRLAEKPAAQEAVALLRMVVSDKSGIAHEIGAKSDWPFHGGLGVVATDAGSAFQSDEFQTAVAGLHGRLEFPPVRVPELRGTIERAFGTIAASLMPLLSGRTFSSPRERGDYDSEARAVLDDEDLLRILLMWVIDVYHHSPHGGLRGQTPADRWRELAQERFVVEPPDRHERRTALGVPQQRTLSNRGVLFLMNHYDCPELREHYRRSRDRRIDIRVDPDDLGAVSVRIGQRWHPAPAVGGGLDGVPIVAWREGLTRVLQRNRDRAEFSRQVRDDAIAAIRDRVDLRVSQLLPGSLDVSPAQIAALDRMHFRGRSFAPEPDGPEVDGRASPFGTLIAPSAPPAAAPDTGGRAPTRRAGPAPGGPALEDRG